METTIAAGAGVRFYPTDEELITLYLFRKHAGIPLLHKEHVFERDLYGSKEPWEVFKECSADDDNENRVRYFFTTLKRKGRSRTRFDRTVAGKNGRGGGTWHGNGKPKAILHDKKVAGHVTTFTYKKKNTDNELEEGGGNNEGGSWLMKEYSLDEKLLKVLKKRDKTVSTDCVLCRIKWKKDKREDRDRRLTPNDQDIERLVIEHTKDTAAPPPPLPPQIIDRHLTTALDVVAPQQFQHDDRDGAGNIYDSFINNVGGDDDPMAAIMESLYNNYSFDPLPEGPYAPPNMMDTVDVYGGDFCNNMISESTMNECYGHVSDIRIDSADDEDSLLAICSNNMGAPDRSTKPLLSRSNQEEEEEEADVSMENGEVDELKEWERLMDDLPDLSEEDYGDDIQLVGELL